MIRPPRMSALSEIIMYEAYRELTLGSGASVSSANLSASSFKGRLSESYVNRTLMYLANKSLLEPGYDPESEESYFSLTDSGIEWTETLLDRNSAAIEAWEQSGIDGFVAPPSSEELKSQTISEAERSDDRWEPLPIDRAAEEYKEALRAVEEAIAEVSKSNGYPTAFPEERDAMIDTLSLGLEALRKPTIIRATFDTLLIRPFKFLMNRFPDAAIGIAAEKALSWLLKIAGLG